VRVQVEIGPVSGASAVAWVAYGRSVVDTLANGDDPHLDVSTLDRFTSLLDEWEPMARDGEPFQWVTERSADEVQFLMKALFEIGLAVERRHAEGTMGLRPPEADEFHITVVRQVLAQMEVEGPSFSHFVDGLRGEWGIAGQQ
jgi:hypothetical protein